MDKYEHVVSLKLTRKQKARLKDAAARVGMNVSEFHRKVLFDAIELPLESRLSLHMQIEVAHFIKQLYADYFGGRDVSPDRLREIEMKARELAPQLLDEFLELHGG
jgi:hypothetical protein